jgi:ribonuclease D
MPTTVPQLLGTKGFHGRAAQREAPRWLRCIAAARALEDLPPLHLPTNAPPPPRVWADRDLAAAERLQTARPLLQEKADELKLPLENLLTPDYLRRVAWRPPADISEAAIAEELSELGARPWQVGLVAPLITARHSSTPSRFRPRKPGSRRKPPRRSRFPYELCLRSGPNKCSAQGIVCGVF